MMSHQPDICPKAADNPSVQVERLPSFKVFDSLDWVTVSTASSPSCILSCVGGGTVWQGASTGGLSPQVLTRMGGVFPLPRTLSWMSIP